MTDEQEILKLALELAEWKDRAEKAEALVERAFRDGIAYASNVNVTDVDLAWEQSQVRAALNANARAEKAEAALIVDDYMVSRASNAIKAVGLFLPLNGILAALRAALKEQKP